MCAPLGAGLVERPAMMQTSPLITFFLGHPRLPDAETRMPSCSFCLLAAAAAAAAPRSLTSICKEIRHGLIRLQQREACA
jgi:hypothetical protein